MILSVVLAIVIVLSLVVQGLVARADKEALFALVEEANADRDKAIAALIIAMNEKAAARVIAPKAEPKAKDPEAHVDIEDSFPIGL